MQVLVKVFVVLILLVHNCYSQNSTVHYIASQPYTGISVVFLESSKSLYYHSGLTSDGSNLQGLHRFYYDLSNESWRSEEQQSYNYPDSRAYYGSFLYENQYIIFGGIGPNGIYNDIWSYNIEYQYWTYIPVLEPILPRYGFAYTTFTYQSKIYFAVLGGKTFETQDQLFDFYWYFLHRYDIAANNWIQQTSYLSCSEKPISNGQIAFYSGSFYLFSGSTNYEDQIYYYNSLCSIDITIPSASWTLVQEDIPSLNSNNGGSCVYEHFLYYFFGWYMEGSSLISASTVSMLDLSNIAQGWQNVTVEGCSDYLKRDGFGYSCNNTQFYVFGGYLNSSITNSALNFTLTPQLATTTCEVMFEDTLVPSRRQGASMVYVTGGFYLFAGENQGLLLNDLWFFNLTSNSWTKIFALGANPTARRRHAADVQGNYMLIVGGFTYNDVLLGDYFLFDTILSVWTEIVPGAGSMIPNPIASTCAMLALPKFYYVGGQTQGQLTLSLWEYDISQQKFSLLYNYNATTDTPLAKHKCTLLEDDNGNKYIYTFFGSLNLMDQPFCGIMMFNLSSPVIVPEVVLNQTKEMPCRTDSAFANLNSEYIVFAGGQRFKQDVFDDVWVISFDDLTETRIQDLSYPVYASASGFINNTLYIYSGFSNNGISLNAPSSDLLQIIQLTNFSIIDSNDISNITCGVGMEFNGEICEFCEPGTYNDDIFNYECIPCPLGSVNLFSGATDISQCVSCPYGFYSVKPGNPCVECAATDTCYIGTSNNTVNSTVQATIKNYLSSNKQPPVYSPPEISQQKEIIFIIAGALTFVYLVAYYFSYNLRVILSYYDIFKNVHFEIHSTKEGAHIPKDHINRPSKFGGFCTIITIIALLTLTCYNLLVYLYTNTIEDIIMVPVGSLTQEHNFGDQEFTIDLMFSSYRGECTKNYLTPSNSDDIYLSDLTVTADGPLCTYSARFISPYILSSGDFVCFNFTEYSSFTSDIIVRLGAESSVPGYLSRVVQNITSSPNMVFRGSTPVVFSYSVLPSYYKEVDMSDNTVSKKGYHISQTANPIAGSQATVDSLPLVAGLSIYINIIRSDIGITTYKYGVVDAFSFFFKLLSDLPGTIVFVGFAMWIAEYLKHLFVGKTSGRFRLAKKQMEEERLERIAKKEERLLAKNRDPSFLLQTEHGGLN